jgi:hypothetical protein
MYLAFLGYITLIKVQSLNPRRTSCFVQLFINATITFSGIVGTKIKQKVLVTKANQRLLASFQFFIPRSAHDTIVFTVNVKSVTLPNSPKLPLNQLPGTGNGV